VKTFFYNHKWKISCCTLAGVAFATGVFVAAVGGALWFKVLDGSIEAHSEDIFAYQNKVAAALAQSIQTIEMGDNLISDDLYDLEEEINDACEPVQTVGFLESQGEQAGTLLRLTAMNALEDCRDTAAKVEYYVWLADREAARAFLGDSYLATNSE
jgi:hypothetical protein